TASAVTISFTLNQGTGTSNTIFASPSAVTFAYPSGTTTTQIGVTSTGAFNAQASSSNGWLLLNNGTSTGTSFSFGASSSFSIQVGSQVTFLTTGTYVGTVTLTNSDNTSTTLPVTLVVNGGSNVNGFSANPASLSFNSSSQQFVSVSCSTF